MNFQVTSLKEGEEGPSFTIQSMGPALVKIMRTLIPLIFGGFNIFYWAYIQEIW